MAAVYPKLETTERLIRKVLMITLDEERCKWSYLWPFSFLSKNRKKPSSSSYKFAIFMLKAKITKSIIFLMNFIKKRLKRPMMLKKEKILNFRSPSAVFFKEMDFSLVYKFSPETRTYLIIRVSFFVGMSIQTCIIAADKTAQQMCS